MNLEEYKIKITNTGYLKNPSKDNIISIGRPTKYQNPFPTKPSIFTDEIYPHKISMQKYKNETIPKVDVSELVKILKEQKELTLSCSCIKKNCSHDSNFNNPRCHGEILAEKVYKELKKDLKMEEKIYIGITGHTNIEKGLIEKKDNNKILTTNIPSFRKEYEFLSNMYPCKIKLSKDINEEIKKEFPYILFNDQEFDSSERLYQYLKSNNIEYKTEIMNSTIKGTKKIANKYFKINKIEYIKGFHENKLKIMKLILKLKFDQNEELKEKLIELSNYKIEEKNDWKDRYWGIYNNEGENHLGKILMDIRDGYIYDNKNEIYYSNEVYNKVYKDIDKSMNRIMNDKDLKKNNLIIISGMARGVDEIFAEYAIKNNLPLILSIPNSIQWHKGRSKRKDGTKSEAYRYEEIVKYVNNKIKNGCKISKIYEIKKDYKSNYSDEIYKFANFARNQHMIDLSDIYISYKMYDSVGTDHAIKNAKKNNKYYGNIGEFKDLKNLLEPFKIQYHKDIFEHNSHILIQGCNCFNTMGAGIAKIIKEKYPIVYEIDQKTKKGDINKLGTFTYADVNPNNNKGDIKYIVNLYSQFTYWDEEKMFNINSFKNGLYNIFDYFIKQRKKDEITIKFSLPAIGLGLANGKIEEVYKVLKDINKLYKNDNIFVDLCLYPNDILNKQFKKLEEEKVIKISQEKLTTSKTNEIELFSF
jgi:predicted NAD-dependent protein-ADP-ribosyltransferase YbiA (DUF1768 family)/O-acetyl-ADP-ribose deacetylase (regulator of RNase III)